LGCISVMVVVGALYLGAARHGRQQDRRRRQWPRRRTASFILALALLTIDLYSGLGWEADRELSAHVAEHMVMWVLVGPLVAASAPIRLAFYALGRPSQQRLARFLHLRAIVALSSPAGSVAVFSTVVLVSHMPAVYDLALQNDYVHALEHTLYLLSAVLMWIPLVGADPLPRRARRHGQAACMAGCMIPMVLISVWWLLASRPIYQHYLGGDGSWALHDQHVAAAIMLLTGIPAFAIPLLSRLRAKRMSPPRRFRSAVSG
jgi:putative membrane protein